MPASSVHVDTRAAFRAALTAVAGMPTIAWEGRHYSPQRGVAFASESVRPISSVVRAVGIGGTIAHTILLSVTLQFPPAVGTRAIEDLAGAIMEALRPGTPLVAGSSAGMIQRVERAGLEQKPDWLTVAVTATAVVYTQN